MAVRVLVVDDAVVFRRAITDALAGVPDVEVVGTAANGKIALSRLRALKPDLMTLDVEMPEMNGIEVLEQMRAENLDTGVIVLSALTVKGGELTIRALELGAFDFLTKPEGGTAERNIGVLRSQLLPLIVAFKRRREVREQKRSGTPKAIPLAAPPPDVAVATRPSLRGGAPIVLIGVSTGGPAALASLLPGLPAGLAAPVLIVQHMPPLFTRPLAESLARKSAMPVKEASDGEQARNGCAYVAPGGRQMKLTRGPTGEVVIRITDDPAENNCKPAVDYLFRSAALQFPGRAVAAILTGMGNDGTQGLRLLKRGGCRSIAQDEASCVVFGMPKEAIQAGVVDVIAPLHRIAAAIVAAVGGAAL
jgi:two-component system chemotaxis response regulator CheB